jgi:hypothetical protein
MRRPRFTYANVMATIAVFIALGGSSVAAVTISLKKNSVKSKNIAAGAVTGSKIKKNAITSSKVKNSSLLSEDFASGQLPAGPKGDKGDKGDTGAAATRLWASIDSGTPSLRYASGVTAVTDSGYSAGSLEVTFDRDVSQCSFQATLLGHGGGYLSPTVSIAITTGFYIGSGLTNQQVRVTTYYNGAPAKRDFDIAAFC